MTLYITEFENIGTSNNAQPIQIGVQAPVAEQTRSISGTSAQSSAFNDRTKFVRLHTTEICSVAFGTNPTATTSTMRMAADTTEYFGVPVGQSYKVAAITNT